MAREPTIDNDVRLQRTRRGWSQEELAGRSGLSRAGISAIETARLVPSTAAALALAAALECSVESLFRLASSSRAEHNANWAWPAPAGACRYWRAQIAGRMLLYPVEVSPLGLLPHDGSVCDGVFYDHPGFEPARTLVLACCDPAAGLLAAELARVAELRLIVLPRSSRAALELLAQGLVHAAGVHLARSDQAEGNALTVVPHLAAAAGRDFHLIRLADWDEGVALQPGLGFNTIREAVGARIRWVSREPGSGARQCLDEVLGRTARRHSTPLMPCARDHRGVADAIRASWADAGICLRLTSDEAGLTFLSVRREAYDICFADELAGDPRLRALVTVARSLSLRRSLGELPGYHTARSGDAQRVHIQGTRPAS